MGAVGIETRMLRNELQTKHVTGSVVSEETMVYLRALVREAIERAILPMLDVDPEFELDREASCLDGPPWILRGRFKSRFLKSFDVPFGYRIDLSPEYSRANGDR